MFIFISQNLVKLISLPTVMKTKKNVSDKKQPGLEICTTRYKLNTSSIIYITNHVWFGNHIVSGIVFWTVSTIGTALLEISVLAALMAIKRLSFSSFFIFLKRYNVIGGHRPHYAVGWGRADKSLLFQLRKLLWCFYFI